MIKISFFFILSLFVSTTIGAQTMKDSTASGFLTEKVSISGIEKGPIEKSKLLSSKGLEFSDGNKNGYKILGYRLTLVMKDRDLLMLDNSSGELSTEMIAAIKDAPLGSKLFFEYIRCMDKEGHYRPAYATEFVLK